MAQGLEKRYECSVCPGKTFRTAQGLQDHCRVKEHWHCHLCDRFFVTSEALQQHQRDFKRHRQIRWIRAAALYQPRVKQPWPCNQCDRSFGTPQALEQHQDSKGHTNELLVKQQVPSDQAVERDWLCQQCERSFGSLQALQQHQDSTMHHKSLPLQPRTLSDQSDKQPSHCQESCTEASSQSTSIFYRGLTYTALTLSEQAVLKPQLLSACHSPNRLALERYPIIATATNRSIPPRNHSRPKSSAVVLDCEMVGTTQGEHVVSLSLIDFFTGSTLVHTLVKPAPGIFITNWRAGITGITPTVMAMAVAEGKALRGRDAAVARLFDFVDDETVLVGHSVNHDLKVLGLVHSRIIDSALLTAEASGMFGGEESGEQQRKIRQSVGLERLCRELTGVRIRGGGATGKGSQSHDSLEDVLATREVVIWCLRHPDALRAWALKNWEGKVNNKKAQRGGNARNRNRNRRRLSGYEYVWDDDDDDDDGEMLRWEDVVDYDTWPKSPDCSD